MKMMNTWRHISHLPLNLANWTEPEVPFCNGQYAGYMQRLNVQVGYEHVRKYLLDSMDECLWTAIL
jgi:hypothetical protein